LRSITDNVEKFYMVLCSLSEANIDIARNIIEAEPTADSFQQLQEALVASHNMSGFQKVNHVVNMAAQWPQANGAFGRHVKV
jgi:hypothetical protein